MAATAAAVAARDATRLELLVIFFLITLIIFFRVSLTRQNFSKQMATAATAATATAPASSAPAAAATPTPAAGAAGGLETRHVSSPSFFPPFSFYFLHSTAASCTHHQYQHIYFKDSKSSFSS